MFMSMSISRGNEGCILFESTLKIDVLETYKSIIAQKKLGTCFSSGECSHRMRVKELVL